MTELSACPALAEALRRHPYGGVILFGANIESTAQTIHLVDDLQRNNARGAAQAVPYLVSADQEGGSVARLTMGTRGTGSMAIGAMGEAAARYYDDYIDGIAALVGEGAIDEARIGASVRRILTLKEKHGLLDPDATPVDERVEAAERIVGSPAHHAVEMDTARQAVTLLKDDGVLPVRGGSIVILGRTSADNTPIGYALEQLARDGILGPDVRIDNRAAVFDSMDCAAAPPALKESGAASEIIGNVLSTLEMNDISAQEALDDIQSQLEDAGLL